MRRAHILLGPRDDALHSGRFKSRRVLLLSPPAPSASTPPPACFPSLAQSETLVVILRPMGHGDAAVHGQIGNDNGRFDCDKKIPRVGCHVITFGSEYENDRMRLLCVLISLM